MAGRFHGRSGYPRDAARSTDREATPNPPTGFGEWWGGLTAVLLGALGTLALLGMARGGSGLPPVDAGPRMLEAIAPAEANLDSIERAFASLCGDPVLLAIDLEPDCETGVMTLSDELFDGFGSASLTPEAKEDVLAAMRLYLGKLRSLPAIWDSLEALEFRGHADPRAVRAPYTTNMVGSQQRPLGVLLFLAGEGGLAEPDRVDLERLALVSGASFSRPPMTCPEETRACYPEWRRVEIRPVLSEPLRRGDWSRTLEEVRRSAQGLAAAKGR